jgi:hypothetical protein
MSNVHQTSEYRPAGAAAIMRLSLLWFGLPGLWMLFNVSVLNPRLVEAGMPLIWSFLFCLYLPILTNLHRNVGGIPGRGV